MTPPKKLAPTHKAQRNQPLRQSNHMDNVLLEFTTNPSPSTMKRVVVTLRQHLLDGRIGAKKTDYILGMVQGYLTTLEASERAPITTPPLTTESNPHHGLSLEAAEAALLPQRSLAPGRYRDAVTCTDFTVPEPEDRSEDE